MSVPQDQGKSPIEQTKDFSSYKPKPEFKAPLWLMILLATITAIIFIWVMLIIAYPSLAHP